MKFIFTKWPLMNFDNKLYLFIQIFFVILFIPFLIFSFIGSLIMNTIINFNNSDEDENKFKSNENPK